MKLNSHSIAVSLIAFLLLTNTGQPQSNPPPVITTQPVSLQVFTGQTAVFNVGVSGSGPFTYQWLENGVFLPNNIITTVAGNGTNAAGYLSLGDGGAATNASLAPSGVAVDRFGNLYIADAGDSRIRKVDPSGIITTVAGGGTGGYSGVVATNASLNLSDMYQISGLAADAEGNVFFADTAYQRVAVITYGFLVTVAGTGSSGYSGDGGISYNAQIKDPSGVAADAAGNVYFGDARNYRIRKVDASDVITTVAGNGSFGPSGDGGAATNASLYYDGNAMGVAVDASGNLFIASRTVRKVDTNGIITTVAGNGAENYSGDGGAATNAGLEAEGVAADNYGNLYIADMFNDRVRKVDRNGFITTVAGNGQPVKLNDGGAATNAYLRPEGVALDASGNLYIADIFYNRIRKVTPAGPVLTVGQVNATNAGGYQVIVSSPYGSVTSSIVTLTVALPQISAAATAGGSVNFSLRTAPNTSSRILAATNLTPPVLWQSLATNTPGSSGTWQFADTNASHYRVRFFRTVTP